ncbi:MAG: hypothetical protein R3A78_06750 [Polyangiales bacterium]
MIEATRPHAPRTESSTGAQATLCVESNSNGTVGAVHLSVQAAESAAAGVPAEVAAAVEQALADLSTALKADPMALLEALTIDQRETQSATSVNTVKSERESAVRAERARRAAIRKAHQASGFLGLGKVLGGLLKAVAGIAAGAAAVLTGGTAGALALTGLGLMLGAKPIAQAAVGLGILSPKDAAKFTLALELTGALLSAGSGFLEGAAEAGARGAASTAGRAANATARLQKAAEVTRAVTTGLSGLERGASAVVRRIQTGHEISAKRAAHRGTVAREKVDTESEELRDAMQSFARIAAQFTAIRETTNEARMTCVRIPA